MRNKFVQVVSWFLVLALLIPSAGYTAGAENTEEDPGITEEIVETPEDSGEVNDEPEETPEESGESSDETVEDPEGSGDASGETVEDPEGSGDASDETVEDPEGSDDASGETVEDPEGSGDASGETVEDPEGSGDASGETVEDPEGSGDASGETGEESGDYPEEPPAVEEAPVEEEPSVAEKIVRIGIYYGTAGKESVSLSISTGTGYHFGYYDSSDNNRFVTISSAGHKKITVTAEQGTMVVTDTSSGKELYRHDSVYGSQMGILPYSDSGEKTVTKCGYNYYGGFRFECLAAYDGTMTIVNMVPLDDYVKGVVPYEMSPSWHEEALKVQAICARTFTLSHNGKHKKSFSFDLCDSDCCQVYKGVYTKTYAYAVENAVEATAGMVLMYDGEYCDTVYSSSNGGSSESAKNVWGKEVPYLQGIIDPYEAYIADRITKYAWTVTFTSEELQEKLVAAGYLSCGLIKEVKTTLSETGNVIALTFVDEADKSYSIYNGTKCRTFLSLRSIHYTVSSENGAEANDGSILANESEALDLAAGLTVINGDGTVSTITEGCIITADGVEELNTSASNSAAGTKFTFSGTGWGHNVGMSQYGAYAMAELGYSYGDILQFYYTGAMIVQC